MYILYKNVLYVHVFDACVVKNIQNILPDRLYDIAYKPVGRILFEFYTESIAVFSYLQPYAFKAARFLLFIKMIIGEDRLDGSVRIVFKLGIFYISSVVDTV